MAKYRTSATALAKTFELSTSPIYIVSDQGELQFMNRACARWVEIDRDAAFNAKVIYTSQPLEEKIEDRLKGLAPPPNFFVDDENLKDRSFWVSKGDAVDSNQLEYRRATAHLLTEGDEESLSLLIICNVEVSNQPISTVQAESAAEWLHHQLAEIRYQNRLAYSLDQLVGTSRFAKRLRRQATLATQSTCDILIYGPTGSGKEHLAKIIHSQSPLAIQNDLVPIQSAVIDTEVFEMLKKPLRRKIQQANLDFLKEQSSSAAKVSSSLSGDLPAGEISRPIRPMESWLLLQIDRLSPESQLVLKQILQDFQTNLRILATSEKRLIELANDGDFDVELAELISGIEIELIPLADRLEDVPLLTQSLIERSVSTSGQVDQTIAGIDKEVALLLTEFRWPGNLDQLVDVIGQATESVFNRLVNVDDLPAPFHRWLQAQRIGTRQETVIDLDQFLASVEKELLQRALTQAQGNKAQAARLLSISRAKLLRKLQQHQIELSIETIASESDRLDQIDQEYREKRRKQDDDSKSILPADCSSVEDSADSEPVSGATINRPKKSETVDDDDGDTLGPEAFEEVNE